MSIERSAEMRYGEQIFEIDVALDDLDWNAASLVDESKIVHRRMKSFTPTHARQRWLFVNARVAADRRGVATRKGHQAGVSDAACSPRGTRQAFFGGLGGDSRLFARRAAAGHTFEGPAVVEAETTRSLSMQATVRSTRSAGWILRWVAAGVVAARQCTDALYIASTFPKTKSGVCQPNA